MNDHDDNDWPKVNRDSNIVLLIAAVAIAVIMGGYAYARHMIGLPL